MNEALANPKFENTFKELGLEEGAGSDGVLPETAGRYKRQTSEDPECRKIRTDWEAFNSTGDQAVQGVTGDVDEAKVTETISALNAINEK